MKKKNFKTGFDSLLEGSSRGETQTKNKTNEIRATFVVKNIYAEKIKAISYWERKMIKDIINEALSNYITTYEGQKGPIRLPE